MEFAAPGSMRMVMKTQNMEQVIVGGAHYMKSDGRWTRLPFTTGWVKLWVGANGLPLKVESEGTGHMLGFSSKSKTTIFYEDYGAPVRIVAPI